jgi:hypothetical protein
MSQETELFIAIAVRSSSPAVKPILICHEISNMPLSAKVLRISATRMRYDELITFGQ